MCGIWGVVGRFSDSDALSFVKTADHVQGHRGPDGTRHQIIDWHGEDRILLGHQRLSIIDLSDAGFQPMTTAGGGSTIVTNGEFYNYIELAADHRLAMRSSSDTEALIEVAERIGLENALARTNGMWALCWVSPLQRRIALARDRAGKKPLYVYRDADRLIFASELKTVAALSGRRFRVNPQAVSDYVDLSLQDVDERSWLEGIESVPAGAVADVRRQDDGWDLVVTRRWSPGRLPVGSLDDSIDRVRELVSSSVDLRLRADVPVGITLSGGIDSSIIAAEIARQRGNPADVHAISAVAPGQLGDESAHIARACDALGIQSHRIDLGWDPAETWQLLDRVTWHNDAPVGSFSNIAFYRLMAEARRIGLKVVLSGQGADEIFCGYRKYFAWAVREFIAQRGFGSAASNLFGSLRHRTVLAQFDWAEAKRYLPGQARRHSITTERVREAAQPRRLNGGRAGVSGRQQLDFSHFSVPYLTHYEDRASMAHGVEVRLPFLDYRLVELGLSLPTEFKVRGGWTKYVLRRAFEDRLPREIIWRRDKQGFSNPQEQWLKGPLGPAFESFYKSDARVFQMGLIDRPAALAQWERFVQGKGGIWSRNVFAPVALESWLAGFSPYISG